MDESNEFKNRVLQNLHLWNSNIEIYHNHVYREFSSYFVKYKEVR